MNTAFLLEAPVDMEAPRRRARLFDANGTDALQRLDAALSTELVAMLRFRRLHYAARGLGSRAMAAAFLVHAALRQWQADALAERMVQLGGVPGFAPEGLERRSHARYGAAATMDGMIREAVTACRISMERYRAFTDDLDGEDATTQLLVASLVATEEACALALAALLPGPSD